MTKNIIRTEEAPTPVGPYSQGVLCGDTLYVSGQIALDPHTGSMADKNIEEETNQVMRNLSAILTAGSMDFTNVVKTTIFIRRMDDFASVNKIYGLYFGTQAPPARESVEVSALPKGANVEISLIAVR